MKTVARILLPACVLWFATLSVFAAEFAPVGITPMSGLAKPFMYTNLTGAEVQYSRNVDGKMVVTTNHDAPARIFVAVDLHRVSIENFEVRNGQRVITDSAADIQYKNDFQALYGKAQQITSEHNRATYVGNYRLPTIKELIWNRASGIAVLAVVMLGFVFRDPYKEFNEVLSKIGLTSCLAIALVQLAVAMPKSLTFPNLPWQLYGCLALGILIVLMWRRDVQNRIWVIFHG
jgi:hypothetical protein